MSYLRLETPLPGNISKQAKINILTANHDEVNFWLDLHEQQPASWSVRDVSRNNPQIPPTLQVNHIDHAPQELTLDQTSTMRHKTASNLVHGYYNATSIQQKALLQAIKQWTMDHKNHPPAHRPPSSPTTNRQILAWFLTGQVGPSSKTIVHATVFGNPSHPPQTPADHSELGRCLKLLEQCPGARAGIQTLAAHIDSWDNIADYWEILTTLHRQESGKPSHDLTNRLLNRLNHRQHGYQAPQHHLAGQ